MKTRVALRNAVVAMVFALGVGSAQAGFIVEFDPDDALRVTAIRNLDFGGTVYDVTFSLSTTAAMVYGDFDILGNNDDFNTSVAAALAVDAVNDALIATPNAETVGSADEGFGSILFRVPYDSVVVELNLDTVLFWEGLR
jgi:hypothetical protein